MTDYPTGSFIRLSPDLVGLVVDHEDNVLIVVDETAAEHRVPAAALTA